MQPSYRIGVVTVTFNSAQVLGPFLDCLLKQTLNDFRVFVIDNASQDNTLACLKEWSDTRITLIANPRNMGIAEGNNQGIRAALAAGCDTILLLNNDIEFPPDLFARLYAGLEDHNCEMTTGKILYFEPSDVIWCAGGSFNKRRLFAAFHYGKGEKDIGQYDLPRSVTYTPTCCLLIRRAVFERVGMMDSRYFVYHDDVDFLFRCTIAEQSLWYLPGALVYHKVSSLTGGDESDFSIRYMTRNRAYFLCKHLPRWKTLVWAVHFLLITAPSGLLFGSDSFRVWRLRCKSMLEGLRVGHA